MSIEELKKHSDQLYAEQVKARDAMTEIAGYELTMNGEQKMVAGKCGFPSLDLETYLRHGYILNPLYRK